jgi:outer membrane protein TolC
LTVSWSIFDGFATKGAKLRALADKRASEQQLNSYIKNAEAARILALEQLDIVLDAAELAEARLNDARGSLKYAEGEVQAGRMAEGQLGNIRIGLQNTEAAAAKARMDVYVKWSEILGTAWADPMLKKIPSSFLSYDR